MKKLISLLMLVVLVLYSCAPHMHRVGQGEQGKMSSITERQWYFLYLLPLNRVDTNAMAGGGSDYTIKTRYSFIDAAISIGLGPLGTVAGVAAGPTAGAVVGLVPLVISSRTVTVDK